MADPDSAAVSSRLNAGLVGDRGSGTTSHSTSYPAAVSHPNSVNRPAAPPTGTLSDTRSSAPDDATRFYPSTSGCNVTGRDFDSGDSQRTGYPASTSLEHHHPAGVIYPAQLPNSHALALSRSNSQGTGSLTNGSGVDPVFTPPASGGRLSPGGGHNSSSQESQLLQLSQIAAAQERIPEDTVDMANGASRKRMADGEVKHTRDKSNVSPGQMAGHSRNTSTVSAASTSASRIGELSAELRARLSYAMVKVNHGWQGHSIDQVESLASQAASPVSSASTIHLRNGSSASPQLSTVSHRASNNTTPATGPQHPSSGRPEDLQWREPTPRGSSASPVKSNHGLAPPVSIQPSQQVGNPRREHNPRHVPSFLSTSHQTSPRANDLRASPYLPPGRHRSAMSEAMLVSPHTNVREQDAIESLLFMSSPGNPANLKHAFPLTSASQPLTSSSHAPPQQRTALPTSQPRKTLPSGRPPHHARSQSHPHSQPTTSKRVGFELKSPSAMDMDDGPLYTGGGAGSPMSGVSRGTPLRKRLNGGTHHHHHGGSDTYHSYQPHGHAAQTTGLTPRLKQMPVSAGLTVQPSKPRPALADDEIDRMLDRAAAAADEESDSEGEIELPPAPGRSSRPGAGPARKDGVGVVDVGV
ncbi:hypothetical protein N657DRAFT_665338 [Parathielavia appendiculata]|uniref:Uncharacterized protein n=1 Tax=Parathielavia appendiculata TaxID=2587402 RepID=A0AAN6TX81_9PEZI|nr:hypothetical protein N657DRAFT_665338 [Parathielavia appendiculata]